MNYVKYFVVLLFLAVLIGCDVPSDTGDVDLDYIVIKGYLYTEQAVEDIRLTTPAPMEEDTTGQPINDATVRLMKDDQVYELVSTNDDGYYHYPGDTLTVEKGDHFRIEVDYFGRTAFAETAVPGTPEDVTLTADTVYVSDPSDDALLGETSSSTDSQEPPSQNVPAVEWSNPQGETFLVVVESTEEDPEPIYEGTFPPAQVITEPTTEESEMLSQIYYIGKHEVIVYRVNTEYEELYEFQEQDSRFLNDPPSNVTNGVGIFTAFSGVSQNFIVVRE